MYERKIREKVIDLKTYRKQDKREYEYKRRENTSMREKVNKRCLC